MDEDIQAAAARLVRRLKEGGHSITVAESCTGGLLTSAFTDIAGASNWFNQSWITYSNEAKVKELRVEEETLEKKGAVSAEVAIQMAKGALENANADIAISITGIAGPASDDTPPTPLAHSPPVPGVRRPLHAACWRATQSPWHRRLCPNADAQNCRPSPRRAAGCSQRRCQ